MCVNCNITAPLHHFVCDLLGLPQNTYGVSSNTFDILEEWLLLITSQKAKGELTSIYEFVPSPNVEPLHNWLKEHDRLKEIDEAVFHKYAHVDIVDLSFINYLLAEHFQAKFERTPVIDEFKVPVELLTTDVERLKRSICKATYSQCSSIPIEIVNKYKLVPQPAIDYGFQLLNDQRWFTEPKEPKEPKKVNDLWTRGSFFNFCAVIVAVSAVIYLF